MVEIYGFSRFKCYTLIDETPEILIKYFMLQYKSCENYEIIDNSKINNNYNNLVFSYFSKNDFVNSSISDRCFFDDTSRNKNTHIRL